VLKARGTGISGSPASIEIGLDPVAGARTVSFLPAAPPLIPYSLCALPQPPGYLGMVAIEGAPRPLLSWQARVA